MPVTVFTAKVIGTVSIGLWAGYNLSFIEKEMLGAHLQAPVRWLQQQLLSGCSRGQSAATSDARKQAESEAERATDAHEPAAVSAATALKVLARSAGASVFAGVVCAANATAYLLSNRASKHPYLLYIAFGAPLVGALQLFGAKELRSQIAAAPSTSTSTSTEEASELSESTYEHVPAPGDGLSPSVSPSQTPSVALHSKYAIYSVAVAGLSTLLSTISVIGLAGDTTVRF